MNGLKMKRKWVLAAGLGLLLLLTACASAPAEFPYGEYASRGGRHIVLSEDGTWSFAIVAGQPLVTGDFTVDGRRITFGDETPAEGQNVPTCEEHGTYTWSFEDNELSFEPVGEDPCDHRAGDLNATFFPSE